MGAIARTAIREWLNRAEQESAHLILTARVAMTLNLLVRSQDFMRSCGLLLRRI